MTPLYRLCAGLTLGFALLAFAPAAFAQDEPPPDGEAASGEANPLPGYLVTAALGAGIVFAICKSARR
ncbi:MAG: hypothetical protein ABI353_24150 [Isosphaeraceae bacterium]